MPYRFDAVPEPVVSPSPARAAGEGLLVFLLHSAATLFCLRPIHRLWRHHLAPDLGDPLFNTWVLDWTMESWRHGLAGLWDAGIYHPTSGALTLSDHLLSPALLALPAAGWADGPVAVYNLLFFLSFPLAGVAAHLVLRAGGSPPAAAFLGATWFAFSHFRWGQASHLQVLLVALVPVLLWTFDRLLAEPAPGRAAAFAAAYAVHVGGGLYLAHMIHLPLAVLLAYRALTEPGWRHWLERRRALSLAAATVVCAAAACAVFLPYAERSTSLDLDRDAVEYRLFGAHSVAWLTPSHHSPLFALAEPALPALAPRFGDRWYTERNLFPGFLPSALAALGLLLAWRGRRRREPPVAGWQRATLRALLAAAAAAFVVADLHTLGWWPAGDSVRWQDPAFVYTALGIAGAAAAIAAFVLRRRWSGRPLTTGSLSRWRHGLLLAGTACLLAAYPVVFTPLTWVLPGLDSMRVPARFFAIASFAVAALVAWGAARLLAPLPRLARLAAGLLLAAVCVAELAPNAFAWHQVPAHEELAPVYAWLAENGDGAVLELPFGDGTGELPYLYAATLHRRPLVNGYSGHVPAAYRRLRAICCWPVPDELALAELRRMEVSTLVVHPVWEKRWAHGEYAAWLARVQAGEIPGVREVYADESGDRVFALDEH